MSHPTELSHQHERSILSTRSQPAAMTYKVLAAGLNTAGADQGLPPLIWTAFHDLDGRWSVHGRPVDLAAVAEADLWAEVLGLREDLMEDCRLVMGDDWRPSRRNWHGQVAGHRVTVTAANEPTKSHKAQVRPWRNAAAYLDTLGRPGWRLSSVKAGDPLPTPVGLP